MEVDRVREKAEQKRETEGRHGGRKESWQAGRNE